MKMHHSINSDDFWMVRLCVISIFFFTFFYIVSIVSMSYFEDQNKTECEQALSMAASRPSRRWCLGCVAWAPRDPFTHPAWPLHAQLPPPIAPFLGTTYVKMPKWPLGL